MHQNVFGGWALPGPTGGAYSTPLNLLARLTGEKRRGKGGKKSTPPMSEVH